MPFPPGLPGRSCRVRADGPRRTARDAAVAGAVAEVGRGQESLVLGEGGAVGV